MKEKDAALFDMARDIVYKEAFLNEDYLDHLIQEGANLNAISTKGAMPLDQAAFHGCLDLVKAYIERGARVEKGIRSSRFETPLHIAAKEGHADIAAFLIDSGMNPSIRNNFNQTPLHRAAAQGHLEVIQVLAEREADLNARDNDDYTPLHWATDRKQVQSVIALIEAGADVNARNHDGKTCLFLAARLTKDTEPLISILLKAGAELTLADRIRMIDYGVRPETLDLIDAGLAHQELAKLDDVPLESGVEVAKKSESFSRMRL